MRQLSLGPRPNNPSEEESIAFLRHLAVDRELSSEQARFISSVARQYQAAGLSWGELLTSGYAGFVKGTSPVTDSLDQQQQDRFGAWWIRQFILQAIADKQ